MPSAPASIFSKKQCPTATTTVGIAEEHASCSPAAWRPWASTPSARFIDFPPARYDCIIHDAALQDLPVIFCMDRAGLSPQDGPTHHGMFDISYLRCVPNIICMQPKDEDELADMMFTATHQQHPAFIRYPRGPAEGVPIKDIRVYWRSARPRWSRIIPTTAAESGLLWFGQHAQTGPQVAAELLAAEGFDIALINPRFSNRWTKERTNSSDGLPSRRDAGGPCLDGWLWQRGPRTVQRAARYDTGRAHRLARISSSNTRRADDLRKKYGLTPENIVARIKSCVERTAIVTRLTAVA